MDVNITQYNILIEKRTKLLKEIKMAEDKLKKIDASMCRYHRPIGNYNVK